MSDLATELIVPELKTPELTVQVLLVISKAKPTKIITREIIQQKIYLMSRLAQKDFGFKNIIYNVYSKQVELVIDKLYNEKLIKNGYVAKPFRSYLKNTELGEQYLSNLSDEVLYYSYLLNKINFSVVFTSKTYACQLLIMDQLAQKLGIDNLFGIVDYMRLLGWSTKQKDILNIYKYLKRFKLPYQKKPKIFF